jgi:hypothetical protein
MSPASLESKRLWQAAHAQFADGQTDQAVRLFERLAHEGFADAQCDLGRLHIFDLIANASPAQGLRWIEAAEQSGHAESRYALAVLALGERLIPLDLDQLETRVQQSAQSGYPPALRTLALHWGRFGTPELHRLGSLCLEHAGMGGDAVSLALLADRLERGDGCEKNQVRAAAITMLLSNSGFPIAPPKQPVNPGLAKPAHVPDLPLLPQPDFRPALAAPALEILRSTPWVATAQQALSKEECRFVTLLGGPMLRPSVTVGPDGKVLQMQLRTSHDMAFDPMHEDVTLRLIQRRMAAAAGLSLAHGEQLILLRYSPGQEYRPHRDYLPPSRVVPVSAGGAGQRQATVIAYLNDVAAGGLTQFPLLDLLVPPRQGDLLAFRNLDPNGNPEPLSLHAGLPVEAGTKWICTLWLHEAPLRSN